MTEYGKYMLLFKSLEQLDNDMGGVVKNTILQNKVLNPTQEDIKNMIKDDKIELMKNKSYDAIIRYKEHRKLLI